MPIATRSLLSVIAFLVIVAGAAFGAAPRIEVKRDDSAGRLAVVIDGNEAFAYFFGPKGDLPYIVPRSPSGKAMTVAQAQPYPHHRSLWFADTVQLAGQRKGDFYNGFYSRKDKKDPNSPFMDRVRNVEIAPPRVEGPAATIDVKLLWEMDGRTPVLDEARRMRLTALGGGEYLLGLSFTLTASYGDVAFLSDAVHYAWPYVRMTPEFSVDKGGAMVDSEGRAGQKATCNQKAWWVDCSNTVAGATEGLALLVHPAGGGPQAAGGPPRWLTRDYGTIGPRRDDARSGKPFTLKKGESITQRVAVLVHRGDAKAGQVAQRYEQWTKVDKP